jgi:alpha-tubulin suppressor-like RCC1 family protein
MNLKLSILLTLFFASCDQGSKKVVEFKLKTPPPAPSKQPPVVEPPPSVVPDGDISPPTPVPDQSPYFRGVLPSEVSMKEGEEGGFKLEAIDPKGGPLNFYFQCPYLCPEGLSVDGGGQVKWKPGFLQSGVYDVRFSAMDSSGGVAVSDLVRIVVSNENRPPILESVSIVPDNPSSPKLLTCVVVKSDKDGDDLSVERSWKVNGLESNDISGQVISAKILKARDSVSCSASVKDEFGATAGPKESPPYVIPNNKPQISGVSIAKIGGGATFKVGDDVGCFYSASDEDLDPLTVSEVKFFSRPDGKLLASAFGGATTNYSYKIKQSDGHKNISCSVVISDGYETSLGESTAALVANSAPFLVSRSIQPDGGAAFVSSGGKVRCDGSFFDPDGDVVTPKVTFYNGAFSRGGGVEFGSSGGVLRKVLPLKTSYDVTSLIDADIRGNVLTCHIKLSDVYGATYEDTTESITIVDSFPTLSSSGGPLSQSLGTGLALTDVKLNGRDNDGETIEYVRTSDSCASKGVLLSVGSDGLVTSNVVPPPTGSQGDRDCMATYLARSGGKDTEPLTLNLSIKNRQPTLTCSGTTQFLDTCSENHLRQCVAAGGAMTTGFCQVSDLDDPSTSGTSYVFSFQTDGCSLANTSGLSSVAGGGVSNKIFEIRGTMGVDTCSSSIVVSDGNLQSLPTTFNLKPTIDMKLKDEFVLDSGCFVEIFPGGDLPGYAPGVSFSSSDVVSSLFGLDKMTIKKTSEKSVSGRFTKSDMTDGLGQDLNLEWTIRGAVAGPPASIRMRKVTRKFQLDDYAVEAPRVAKAIRPVAVLGQDAATGRQASMSERCVKEDSGCSGDRRASLAAGDEHVCVVSGTGSVVCWGDNSKQQLGSPSGAASGTPTTVTLASESWTGTTKAAVVASGAKFSCSLSDDAKVRCWGDNSLGQLGRGTADVAGIGSGAAVQKAGGGDLSNIVLVATGAEHACALDADGLIHCWGKNNFGQLGAGWLDTSEICSGQKCKKLATPVDHLPIVGKTVSGLAAGGDATCVTFTGGDAACFGDRTHAQLGTGTPPTVKYGIFYEISADGLGNDDDYCTAAEKSLGGCELSSVRNLTSIWSIHMSRENTCSLSSGGVADCWGRGGLGQLGNQQNIDMPEPKCLDDTKICFSHDHVMETFDRSQKVGAISPGAGFMCFVGEDRRIQCYGDNTKGQLGSGLALSNSVGKTPSVVKRGSSGDLTDAIAISSGRRFACAVVEGSEAGFGNDVLCWGDGSKGQLGDGSTSVHVSTTAVKASGGDLSVGAAAKICEGAYRLTPVFP